MPRATRGNEVNGEDRRITPRSSTYFPNNDSKISVQHLSPPPRLPNSPSGSSSSGYVSTKDSEQQRMPPGLLRPRTPIARHNKSMSVNSTQSQGIPRRAFDIPDSKSRVEIEIELVSLSENRNEFNEAELKFLHWLDTEIAKIDEFYHEKEKVAAERFKIISVQLEALCQLRDSHKTDEWNEGSFHPRTE